MKLQLQSQMDAHMTASSFRYVIGESVQKVGAEAGAMSSRESVLTSAAVIFETRVAWLDMFDRGFGIAVGNLQGFLFSSGILFIEY